MTIVVCQLDSAHRTAVVLRRRVWVFVSSLVFVVSGPDYLHSRLNDACMMHSHLSDEMGAAAYRLPARWQDYARCTYAVGLSVGWIQALVPRFQGGYICLYLPVF